MTTSGVWSSGTGRPAAVVPFGWPGVEQVVNGLEHLIHHEDIRRGTPTWEPRDLPESDEASIWRTLSVLGRALVRPAGVPVRIAWGSRTATLRGGDDPVVVRGTPSELALVLHGRARAAHATYDGPDAAVDRLRGADLGV